MSVYFIRVGRYVKVGYSENPEQRFRRLFSSTTSYTAPWDAPRSLTDRTLIGYVRGGKNEECEAHNILAEYSVGCEFYLAERPLLDYVDQCLKAGRVVAPRLPRTDGPAERVGQVPPGAHYIRTTSDITAARKAAS